MKNDNESIKLYMELLELCGDIVNFVEKTKTYPSQLGFNSLNEECYGLIYESLKNVVPRKELLDKSQKLKEECPNCWKFYLAPRNRSIRILDIKLGQKFEHKLIEFFKLKEIDCRKGDEKNKIYPDNVVYKNGEKKAYLEIKYQSAPWIFAFREEGTSRECYEGSPALDIKKLEQQYKLRESGEVNVPIYYVYWLDFPCIKGIFFISVEDMYQYYKEDAKLFDRKEREGDFKTINGKKIKVSATSKIHPSLFKMGSFNKLMESLK
jgi:hypothetical protein